MKKFSKLFLFFFLCLFFVSIPSEKQTSKKFTTETNQSVLAINNTKTNVKNLAIFIRFNDSLANHHLDEEQSILNAYKLFNSEESIAMDSIKGIIKVPSFKTYYERESYGNLSITTEIFPKENNKVVAYRDNHPIGYYLRYSENNKIGYQTKAEALKRETELVNNAVSYIKNMVESSGISSIELDPNGDGIIDAISFIIEGQKDLPNSIAFNDLLWSHMQNNSGITNTIFGKKVSAYTFLYATDYKESAGLFSLNRGTYGTIIHEFGHTLGYMDLYRHGSNANPVGFYDIMGNTIGSNPQSFLTYFVSEYHQNNNWHDPLPVIDKTTKDITLYKPQYINKNEKRAVKIEVGGNKDEYFILEYHEKLNTYDSYSAESSGIIIYRVNEKNKFKGNNGGGINGEGDHIYVFRPNETGLGNGKGDLSLATLNQKRPKFGTELVFNQNTFDNQSIFFSDGTNSGLIIEVTNETASSITFNIIYPKTEGEGTKDNPYLIRNTETYLYLMGMSTTNKYYKLMNDLDFSGVDYPNLSMEGNFDGNNKVLKNITSKKQGVFQTIGNDQTKTFLKNLTIENINATSNTGFTLGGLANHAVNIDLYNIHIKSGNVIQESSPLYDLEATGGFLGSADNQVKIESCSSKGTVKGIKNVGGFLGLNKNAQIEDSFVISEVVGTNMVGAFLGVQLIMDNIYQEPKNVYFDGKYIKDAVGGYDKTFHRLEVLSEDNLTLGIRKVVVSPTFSVTQYTKEEIPIKIEPNASISYNIHFENESLANYQEGKIEGLKVGKTSVVLELLIGKGKMVFPIELTIEASNKTLTEKEVLSYLGLTKVNQYVIGFALGTSLLDIQNKLLLDPRIEFMFFKNNLGLTINEGLVATGIQFGLKFNQQAYTYTIVIKGDVNGDGYIYATDYVKVRNHIMGKSNLTGAYLLAADINNDHHIYATDYVQIRNHIMGKTEIVQK